MTASPSNKINRDIALNQTLRPRADSSQFFPDHCTTSVNEKNSNKIAKVNQSNQIIEKLIESKSTESYNDDDQIKIRSESCKEFIREEKLRQTANRSKNENINIISDCSILKFGDRCSSEKLLSNFQESKNEKSRELENRNIIGILNKNNGDSLDTMTHPKRTNRFKNLKKKTFSIEKSTDSFAIDDKSQVWDKDLCCETKKNSKTVKPFPEEIDSYITKTDENSKNNFSSTHAESYMIDDSKGDYNNSGLEKPLASFARSLPSNKLGVSPTELGLPQTELSVSPTETETLHLKSHDEMRILSEEGIQLNAGSEGNHKEECCVKLPETNTKDFKYHDEVLKKKREKKSRKISTTSLMSGTQKHEVGQSQEGRQSHEGSQSQEKKQSHETSDVGILDGVSPIKKRKKKREVLNEVYEKILVRNSNESLLEDGQKLVMQDKSLGSKPTLVNEKKEKTFQKFEEGISVKRRDSRKDVESSNPIDMGLTISLTRKSRKNSEAKEGSESPKTKPIKHSSEPPFCRIETKKISLKNSRSTNFLLEEKGETLMGNMKQSHNKPQMGIEKDLERIQSTISVLKENRVEREVRKSLSNVEMIGLKKKKKETRSVEINNELPSFNKKEQSPPTEASQNINGNFITKKSNDSALSLIIKQSEDTSPVQSSKISQINCNRFSVNGEEIFSNHSTNENIPTQLNTNQILKENSCTETKNSGESQNQEKQPIELQHSEKTNRKKSSEETNYTIMEIKKKKPCYENSDSTTSFSSQQEEDAKIKHAHETDVTNSIFRRTEGLIIDDVDGKRIEQVACDILLEKEHGLKNDALTDVIDFAKHSSHFLDITEQNESELTQVCDESSIGKVVLPTSSSQSFEDATSCPTLASRKILAEDLREPDRNTIYKKLVDHSTFEFAQTDDKGYFVFSSDDSFEEREELKLEEDFPKTSTKKYSEQTDDVSILEINNESQISLGSYNRKNSEDQSEAKLKRDSISRDIVQNNDYLLNDKDAEPFIDLHRLTRRQKESTPQQTCDWDKSESSATRSFIVKENFSLEGTSFGSSSAEAQKECSEWTEAEVEKTVLKQNSESSIVAECTRMTELIEPSNFLNEAQEIEGRQNLYEKSNEIIPNNNISHTCKENPTTCNSPLSIENQAEKGLKTTTEIGEIRCTDKKSESPIVENVLEAFAEDAGTKMTFDSINTQEAGLPVPRAQANLKEQALESVDESLVFSTDMKGLDDTESSSLITETHRVEKPRAEGALNFTTLDATLSIKKEEEEQSEGYEDIGKELSYTEKRREEKVEEGSSVIHDSHGQDTDGFDITIPNEMEMGRDEVMSDNSNIGESTVCQTKDEVVALSIQSEKSSSLSKKVELNEKSPDTDIDTSETASNSAASLRDHPTETYIESFDPVNISITSIDSPDDSGALKFIPDEKIMCHIVAPLPDSKFERPAQFGIKKLQLQKVIEWQSEQAERSEAQNNKKNVGALDHTAEMISDSSITLTECVGSSMQTSNSVAKEVRTVFESSPAASSADCGTFRSHNVQQLRSIFESKPAFIKVDASASRPSVAVMQTKMFFESKAAPSKADTGTFLPPSPRAAEKTIYESQPSPSSASCGTLLPHNQKRETKIVFEKPANESTAHFRWNSSVGRKEDSVATEFSNNPAISIAAARWNLPNAIKLPTKIVYENMPQTARVHASAVRDISSDTDAEN